MLVKRSDNPLGAFLQTLRHAGDSKLWRKSRAILVLMNSSKQECLNLSTGSNRCLVFTETRNGLDHLALHQKRNNGRSLLICLRILVLMNSSKQELLYWASLKTRILC